MQQYHLRFLISNSNSEVLTAYTRNQLKEMFAICNTPEFVAEFKNLNDYDCQLGKLSKANWKQPFKNAAANEIQRQRYANLPLITKAPEYLNSICGPFTAIAACCYAFISNIKDIVTGNILYFEKTGDMRRTYFWNRKDFTTPFAKEYLGNNTMSDPRRISVQGLSFTTYARAFRDNWMNHLFGYLQRDFNVSFFIVDLKGCHACFQASLLGEETPILYQIYTEKLDIWEQLVRRSPNDALLSMSEKRLMKIVFYAALNGGSIASTFDIIRHINVHRATPGDEVYAQLENFANRFIKNPIVQELQSVKDFWASCEGKLYVPTRVEPIVRLLNVSELKSKTKIYHDRQSAKFSSFRKAPQEGDLLVHKLPTLYYTSLEVIWIQKVVGLVVKFAQSLNIQVQVCQSIHDGVIFCSDNPLVYERLSSYVNGFLGVESEKVLGVSLSVSITDCSESDWINRLSETQNVELETLVEKEERKPQE
jgi:hypothetical protein